MGLVDVVYATGMRNLYFIFLLNVHSPNVYFLVSVMFISVGLHASSAPSWTFWRIGLLRITNYGISLSLCIGASGKLETMALFKTKWCHSTALSTRWNTSGLVSGTKNKKEILDHWFSSYPCLSIWFL